MIRVESGVNRERWGTKIWQEKREFIMKERYIM